VPRSLSTRGPSMRVIRAESNGGRGNSARLRNRTCIFSRCVLVVEMRWKGGGGVGFGGHASVDVWWKSRVGIHVAAVRPLPNRRHWHIGCLAPSPEGQWRRHAARPARRRGQSTRAGRWKFDRTLRCARDPCPADGLAPPGSSRPRRQPLVRLAPGSNRFSCCRTSRLSTPRARGPVLAAGARTHDVHVRMNALTT
jgi:hypothetical protein